MLGQLATDARHASSDLDVIVQIAEERRGYLERMREALSDNDDDKLKMFARKLCGLSMSVIAIAALIM